MVTPTGRRRARRAGSVTAAVALAVGALLLAGCSASSGGSTSGSAAAGGDAGSAAGGEARSVADSAPLAAASAPAGDAASVPGAGGDLPADSARQVITTGSASLAVDDPADAVTRIAVLVEGAGGRVEERSVQTPQDGPSSASLTVRVPAGSLTRTVEDLGTIGTVSGVSVTATDVTAQATDLDARIAALRTSTERLTALLAGAASTEEVVAAESALTQRQAELDSLTGQRALLAGQVEMATLSLSVTERASAPAVEAGGFAGGLASGWRALVAAVSGALVVAGVLLPWLVAAALVGGAVLGSVRLVGRVRGTGRSGSAAAEPDEG